MFVYKFLDSSDNAIYVGKTTNIYRRLVQHFSERGHLPEDCYENVERVEFLKLESLSNMTVAEI